MKIISRILSDSAPRRWGISIIVCALLAGCGSQGQQSKLPPMPQDQLDTVEIAVDFPPVSNLAQNTVQVPYSDIPVRSSVVISHGDLTDDRKQGDRIPVNENQALAVAKEEMEKELIRRGFRIIDQQQVEAGLRQLAFDKPCENRTLWWRCSSLLNSNEVAYLDALKARGDKGEVPAAKVAEQMEKSEAIWLNRATGLKALLRAAREKRIQLDYVLEIKTFDPGEAVTQTLDLNNVAEVRRFLGNYPDLQGQLADRRYLRCTALGAQMKARLINTANSEVVWLGGHTVSEADRLEAGHVIELGVRRSVANGEEVRAAMAENKSVFGRSQTDGDKPAWEFRSELVGPRVIQGSCGVNTQQPDMLQMISNRLAGQTARELVATIDVLGGQIRRSSPPSFDNAGFPPGGASTAGGGSDSNRFLRDSVGPIQTE